MRENKQQCYGFLNVNRITDKANFCRVVESNSKQNSYHWESDIYRWRENYARYIQGC